MVVVNSKKFDVDNLTNTEINIPWGVEIVWAVLTPKNVTNASKIQKIVVASVYCKPDSRKKLYCWIILPRYITFSVQSIKEAYTGLFLGTPMI